MNNFGLYSNYYDLLYKDKDYSEEAAYVTDIVNNYGDNVKNILELGCGTAEHAINLAGRGFNVNGIDISEEMLVRGSEKLESQDEIIKNSINLSLGDVRNFSFNKTFDCIISLFHVVSYQTGNNDIASMFDSVSKHLDKGGIFLFDCWYGPAVLNNLPEVRVKRFENDEIYVTRIAEPELHPNDNIVDVNYTIIIRDKNSNVVEELKEKHRMRYLFSPEILQFANAAGLQVEKSEEWLSGNNPGVDTWGVSFVLRK